MYSIGAVEPAYAATNRMPLNHSIRLALTAGNWTTVVPVTTTTTADTVYSNFAPMQARYLELKMMGSPVANGLPAVSELFVYPSAQQTPGPTTADGYDIGYLGKLSVNGNFQPPIVPLEWPTTPVAPKTLAQGATGGAVATLDLGGQYPLSRVSVGFQNSVTWASGGRVDVAAIPDAYTTVYDSGAGQQFGPAAALGTCQEFYFPLQLVRYVRLTDYFIPGSGPSGGTVWSIQAYTTPAATPLNYPLSADGKYFTVNLLRRPTTFTQPTATVVYANGALVYTPNPVGQIPANIFDGDDLSFGWRTATPTSAATATVTIDLGQVESIGAMRQVYSGPLTPTAYSVRIAQSLGTWTQLIPDTLTTTWDFSTSFAAASARYVELTMRGSPAQNIVSLAELFLFPSSATTPAPVSTDALDHTYLTGMNYTLNSNMLYGGDGTYSRVQQKDFYGKPLAQGSNGDAILTYDLGQEYQVSQVDLAFYLNQNWPEGGKVEAGDGSGNWSTVFDSGVGNAFGPPSSAGNGGSVSMPFTTRTARYIRLTGYFVPGVGAARGMIQNVEVF